MSQIIFENENGSFTTNRCKQSEQNRSALVRADGSWSSNRSRLGISEYANVRHTMRLANKLKPIYIRYDFLIGAQNNNHNQ